ncbi:MAG: class 1 fructose-bisphosphatase [Nitrospirae bacterium]|nr:class 1 fructose-bisphosphatase [Nitrospirota bacterium]
MNTKGITLTRHILLEQRVHPSATGELSMLLTQIGLVTKIITRAVSRAGLVDILGVTGEVNVHGEEVKRLDEYANQTFINVFGHSGLVCTLVSEEMEKPRHLSENCSHGKYTLFFDPLDGSSNIDVNGTIGTIFSIHHRLSGAQHRTDKEWSRVGSDQVVAGYVIFGPSTVLVYTAGNGVHGFTLDPSIGEFLLSHENIRIPSRGKTYSVNEGHYPFWQPHTRALVDYLKEKDPTTGRPYSSRYVGSLVADFHRTLLHGGIFLYPSDTKNPQGKLRLLYEAAPLAFVVEQAGGRAGTGHERILDIRPVDLHQRVPLIIGSKEDVIMAEEFCGGRKKRVREKREKT